MIDFEIGDELELVRETARDFAADHLRPSLREHESARSPGEAARSAFATMPPACVSISNSRLSWASSCTG